MEGGELEVIESLKPTLHRDLPIVILEVLPVYSADNRPRLERQELLEKILREATYELYRIEKGPRNEWLGLRQISEIGIHSDLDACDYVATAASEKNRICALFAPCAQSSGHGVGPEPVNSCRGH